MRKSLLLSAVAVAAIGFGLTVSTETRAAGYGMAGCGLGSIVIKNNNILQIFAATTNGTSGNQTFGITTGTSNCSGGGTSYIEQQQETFVSVNYENLEQQMAAGKGENLEAFAQLLGCSSTSFAKMSKDNYSKFFSSTSTPAELLQAVKAEIKTNKSVSCSI